MKSAAFAYQRPATVADASGAVALAGAGTTQADATPITACNSVFDTAAASTGARLPANCSVGDELEVVNLGANALLVYPPVGGKVNALADDAGFSVAAGKTKGLTHNLGGAPGACVSFVSVVGTELR